MQLRKLPELGRDELEKDRLTAFLNPTLDSFRAGAAAARNVVGWRNSQLLIP